MEAFLLGAALAGLGVWGASLVLPALWEQWANWTFDRQVQESQQENPAATREDTPRFPTKPGTSETPRPPIEPHSVETLEAGKLIGRLSIPRLHLSAMVREGDEETTLSLALGHIPGTALPGQSGNVGIAGHRDAVFRGLREVQKNDLIRFETVGGSHTYRVEEMEIVQPKEVSVLKASQHSELTLVTCYPFYFIGSAPERYIVKAREVTVPETFGTRNASRRRDD